MSLVERNLRVDNVRPLDEENEAAPLEIRSGEAAAAQQCWLKEAVPDPREAAAEASRADGNDPDNQVLKPAAAPVPEQRSGLPSRK